MGFDENDPIFLVPDLAPHVDHPNRSRKSRDVIKKEELHVIIAAKPDLDKTVKELIVDFLKTEYDISVEDLVSAELALVPATKPRDVGFDRSMIAAYGQDDKASSIAAVTAIFEQKTPELTSLRVMMRMQA